MDAATDRVGRSYNRGKTLDDYIGEIKEAFGTRYAPWAYELLTDSTVRDELEHILDHERSGIYKETYNLLKHVNKGLSNL